MIDAIEEEISEGYCQALEFNPNENYYLTTENSNFNPYISSAVKPDVSISTTSNRETMLYDYPIAYVSNDFTNATTDTISSIVNTKDSLVELITIFNKIQEKQAEIDKNNSLEDFAKSVLEKLK
jgi:hypothetical protein